MKNAEKRLFIAEPHGFCNGVIRALKMVEQLLLERSCDIFIYNDIVHNSFVVNDLKKRGVHFVRSLDDVPPGSLTVWSAHGVAPALEEAARAKDLIITDATCPLVKKVHDLAGKYLSENCNVIFAGHANHPETVGVLGCGNIILFINAEDCRKLPELPPARRNVMLTQTTWCREDVEAVKNALQERFPDLECISNICYATGERQQAVRDLIVQQKLDYLLVIGSPHSSNSRRLSEVAENCGIPAHLIDDPQEIKDLDLAGVAALGITAGASAPEFLLEQAVKLLNDMGYVL